MLRYICVMVLTYMVMDYSSLIYADSTWHSVRKLPSRVERIHCSLGGAGLGLSLIGRVFSVHGSGWVCSGSSGNRSRFALTGILGPQRAAPQALTLLFSGMPTWPEALGMPGVSGLRPCARTPPQRPCAILVQLVGWKTNTETSKQSEACALIYGRSPGL